MNTQKKNVCAIVEARMSSTRLPGKVLMDIGGKPSILHTVERLRLVPELNDIIIATSINQADDVLESFCLEQNLSFFRGSEDNVLNRVLGASIKFNVDIIVEITGDSVFIDHSIISLCINEFTNSKFDFVANCVKNPKYIPGFDARVFKRELLVSIEKMITENEDLEHVTSYIWKNPKKFKIKHIKPPSNLAYKDIFLGLDTLQDLELLRAINFALGKNNMYFDANDIVNFLRRNPELLNR